MGFVLVTEQVYEEIEVFDVVGSFVEEGLDVGVDFLVDFGMMILLEIMSGHTS